MSGSKALTFTLAVTCVTMVLWVEKLFFDSRLLRNTFSVSSGVSMSAASTGSIVLGGGRDCKCTQQQALNEVLGLRWKVRRRQPDLGPALQLDTWNIFYGSAQTIWATSFSHIVVFETVTWNSQCDISVRCSLECNSIQSYHLFGKCHCSLCCGTCAVAWHHQAYS